MKTMMKKLSALIISVAMMLTLLATSALAADSATLSISDLKEGDTVTLYQIWNGTGDANTFTGWTKAAGTEGLSETEPTMQQINDIAQGLLAGTIAPQATETATVPASGTFTKDVDHAVAYIAVITPASGNGVVYNPVLLAASYAENNGAVSLTSNPVSIKDAYLYGTNTVAKSSEPTITKDAEATPDVNSEGETIQTASVGDKVTYTVQPTRPQYPANATDKTFFINDTMSDGLSLEFDSLKVNGIAGTMENGVLVFKDGDKVIARASQTANGYNMAFVYDNLTADPTVTYAATITDAAVVGTDGNPNTVTLYYTNNPNTGSTHENPKESPKDDQGKDYVTKEDEEIVYTYEIKLLKTDDDETNPKPLAGAVFGIYEDEACTKLVDTVTTNAQGIASSSQVGKGTYYVKELIAPEGYTLNTEVKSVEANWKTATTKRTAGTVTTEYTSNQDEATVKTQAGWLKDGKFYSLDNQPTGNNVLPAYIKGTTTTSETATYTENNGEGSGVVSMETWKDTKLKELPSTGGMGIYLFTICGVVMIVTAAGLYMSKRRREN